MHTDFAEVRLPPWRWWALHLTAIYRGRAPCLQQNLCRKIRKYFYDSKLNCLINSCLNFVTSDDSGAGFISVNLLLAYRKHIWSILSSLGVTDRRWIIIGLSASFTIKTKSPKCKQFCGNLRKQTISIISRLDTERLNSERNIIHILTDGIKTANDAGRNDNKRRGNKDHITTCVLFQTPKIGFTYAVGAEKTRLYGKKNILSTFLPIIQQKRAWPNSCMGRQRITMAIRAVKFEPRFL